VKPLIGLYVVAIALGTYVLAQRGSATKEERPMNWSQLADVVVEARPKGVWTWAVEYVKGPALILIEAEEGNWSYSKGSSCGADGDLNSLISAQHAILPTAPIGALIVKIGGSTAGAADGTIRVGGTKAIIQIDDKTSGPIFLTINDDVTGLVDNKGSIKAKVSMALLPAPPPAAGATPEE
jgi:hypothetical protein